MHDIVALEDRGVVSVFVASSQFQAAAEIQARALGYEPAAVYVPHPIQDRTDMEMQDLARASLDNLLNAVCKSATSGH